jgi:hypothetical protein
MFVMKKKNTEPKSVGRSGKSISPGITRDIDDLVHSANDEIANEADEMDPDDLVHQRVNKKADQIDERLADPDDLVHDPDEDEDDRR